MLGPLARLGLGSALASALLLLLLPRGGDQAALDGGAAALARPPRHAQAYVSLLYDDSFVVGLRVLGQSLRETGTERDLVAIVAGELPPLSLATLARDGWRLVRVDPVANPGRWEQGNTRGARFPRRFWGVYTKLLAFNLTDYTRVVYLDADTIVTRNTDALFGCAGFCAALRSAERFNTGVLVLEPSAPLAAAMLAAAASTPSYTGGDQGFLNSFFADFAGAPLFDDGSAAAARGGAAAPAGAPPPPPYVGARGVRLQRLPTRYNADLGLYVSNSNRWAIPEAEIAVVHFTLATFKPWDWWGDYVLGGPGAGREWQALRRRLPPAADGRRGGETAAQARARWVLAPLPLVAAAAAARAVAAAARGGGGGGAGGAGAGGGKSPRAGARRAPSASHAAARPPWFDAAAIAAAAAALGAALGAACRLVPRQIAPRWGWALAYEWTALLALAMLAAYLRGCYLWGRAAGGAARAAPGGGAAFARAAAGGGSRAASPRAGARPASPRFGANGHSLASLAAAGPLHAPPARPWAFSARALGLMLAAVGSAPWWGPLLSASLTSKVFITGICGAASLVVAAQCAVAAAAAWYAAGRAEAELAAALAGAAAAGV